MSDWLRDLAWLGLWAVTFAVPVACIWGVVALTSAVRRRVTSRR